MRITQKDIYRVLQMSDQDAGKLFKKYLKAKQGINVEVCTDLEEHLLKNKPKEKKTETYHKDAYFVYNVCLNYFDETLHPKDTKTRRNWLQTIDGLLRIDKIAPNELLALIRKAREDEFWRKNFLSITKLRKNNKDGVKYIHYFQILFKKKEEPKAVNPYARNTKKASEKDLEFIRNMYNKQRESKQND